MGPYKEAGKSYINWCAQMATSQNIGVPWIMCQQSDAPQPMVLIFIYLFMLHCLILNHYYYYYYYADKYMQWVLLR